MEEVFEIRSCSYQSSHQITLQITVLQWKSKDQTFAISLNCRGCFLYDTGTVPSLLTKFGSTSGTDYNPVSAQGLTTTNQDKYKDIR